MMTSARWKWKGTLLGLALVATGALGGCEEDPQENADAGIYSDGVMAVATVQGFVWDAEAFYVASATCTKPCAPSTLAPSSALFRAAIVPGATIGLFDPQQPQTAAAFPATDPSGTDGGFYVEGVPLRATPPFLPYVSSVQQLATDAGAPTFSYLPTRTLKGIATSKTTFCVAQPANVVSDSGVLDAVARYRTSIGTPTTVGDLVDPSKSGGVVVWWLWNPGAATARVPALGAAVTADVGETFNLAWSAPGKGPAFQAARGFWVNTMGPTTKGALPVTVTLLPPNAGTPPMVTFTATDSMMAADGSRPFNFPKLAAIEVAPGVTYGELQALTTGAAPPAVSACNP